MKWEAVYLASPCFSPRIHHHPPVHDDQAADPQPHSHTLARERRRVNGDVQVLSRPDSSGTMYEPPHDVRKTELIEK